MRIPIIPEHPDGPIDPIKGRGTAWRVAHRFSKDSRENFDDGWGPGEPQGEDDDFASAQPPRTQVREEHVKSILSANDSPDVPFELSINPYRGCEHGCIYCFARPTHSYLNLSPGLDFETQIVAKMNAADCLEVELGRRGYKPSPINIGSATDAYQPVERDLGITRRVIEVLERCEHPYTLVTKSAGVERDIDLIAASAARTQAAVFMTVTTLDNRLSRVLEPRATAPQRRLQAVRRMADAGIPVGVNVAPIIPFVNEPEIEHIVEAAAQAGAASIHYTVVRLPWEVAPLFKHWLEQHFPQRAERVMARIQEMRGGRDYDADFRTRMRGEGLWADLIRQRIDKATARHGLVRRSIALDSTRFRAPSQAGQGSLF